MKLLLTSNGITTKELKRAFSELTKNKKGLRVAIIPTAGDPIEWVPDAIDSKSFTAKLTRTPPYETEPEKTTVYKEWKEMGHHPTIVSLRDDPEKIKGQLSNVDIIDVTGGDVNYLLDWAKEAKLDTYLRDLLDNGVLYIGSSAGNGLLMPDIGLTWWEEGDDTDHVGFGIVDFIMVVHQKETDERSNTKNLILRQKYMRSAMNYPWKIYLVQDGQAIKVDGDKIEPDFEEG